MSLSKKYEMEEGVIEGEVLFELGCSALAMTFGLQIWLSTNLRGSPYPIRLSTYTSTWHDNKPRTGISK
jgi:hypothetical protein